MAGLFSKLKEKLTKTRQGFVDKVERIFTGATKIDEDLYEELEEALIQSDVGISTSMELVENLRKKVKERKIADPLLLNEVLKENIVELLGEKIELKLNDSGTTVYLVVGVNGVGKTTTLGKLARHFRNEGKSVLLAAGDTFRAAAIEQLEAWGQRAGVDVIKQSEGADPAAVTFDALQAAKARKTDILLVDTAGRLHNKVNLMKELTKMKRVVEREIPSAPHEVLLILDATTGQNAIQQVRIFQEAAEVTGIILTKLDGTAKGGVILGIQGEARVPVKMIGIGEGLEDLKPFEPDQFAEALFGEQEEEE
ncbi:signal recognition particle-docking protein FtsY [Syntrophobotulus glycolicus DSM 8271]|uniref:Signal recognition particle receptor FtsY n=1 Tax=Syntrophobotulus glycolicus (strain DSM 8271 / FlGlyR) TaxID=645991 RepID=F0SUE8_SYNGF|nr:signal recognition particle-docking protein FtsY [Syntrophobotulus glycolicus]ADY56598.1 signal recognition particle-docking protein FtsY [Syntrophobotulus glycolicus DSM 8271]